MAENTELEAFLSRGAPTSEPEPAPVEQPAAAPEPKGEAAAKPAAEPAKPDEPDDEPPEPRDGEPVIPRRAFEAIRHERQDWKAKAVKAETEREELRRQLEEAKRAAAQPPPQQQQYQPPPPPPEIPNPAHDPQGYHNFMLQQQYEAQMHQFLNISEMHAVREHGQEAVEAMKREFLAAKERDPTLGQKLLQQRDPYGWAMAEIKKIQRLREVGEDPDAYDARIRAEAIAEFQKNGGQTPPPRVSPAAGMAPSLANARSVAGRSAPAFTGPTPLGEIIAQIHRKS